MPQEKNKDMKTYLSFALIPCVMLLASCSKNLSVQGGSGPGSNGLHGEIKLGNRLENPYSVENVKSTVAAMYSTKAADMITATDYYVRFLPKSGEQLDYLKAMGVTMLDHPMDYEILQEGDFYHDPSLDSREITWQYAVVPKDFHFPPGIRHELIQQCFIADNSSSKALDGIDWDAVEREAFVRTGNEAMLASPSLTRAGESGPKGRIMIIDSDYNGGQPMGVSGVKVECNVFVKFSSAYTDRDGYYQIPKTFTSNPRYRLVFANEKGFSIGFNTVLYKGSVSGLGKNPVNGLTLTVDSGSDRALFRRCVANNAAYDFYARCQESDLNLPEPPSDLSFWMFDFMDDSSTVMLHHGTVLKDKIDNIYYKIAAWVVQLLGPDITLGTQSSTDFKSIYSSVIHEMAHACHFAKVGNEYWDDFIFFVLDSAIRGGHAYGDASQTNAGMCAVGEMWAYYMESKFYKERYGGGNPAFGSNYWFHPQIFTSLESKGFSCKDIFEAMGPEVKDVAKLKETLVNLYPSKKTTINQVFNRYE